MATNWKPPAQTTGTTSLSESCKSHYIVLYMWRYIYIYIYLERGVRYLINDNKFLLETPVSLLYLIPSNTRRSFILWTHVPPEEVLQSRCHFSPVRLSPRKIGFFAEINHLDEDTDTVLSETRRTCSCACKC